LRGSLSLSSVYRHVARSPQGNSSLYRAAQPLEIQSFPYSPVVCSRSLTDPAFLRVFGHCGVPRDSTWQEAGAMPQTGFRRRLYKLFRCNTSLESLSPRGVACDLGNAIEVAQKHKNSATSDDNRVPRWASLPGGNSGSNGVAAGPKRHRGCRDGPLHPRWSGIVRKCGATGTVSSFVPSRPAFGPLPRR
jgi:hypothetical protein